MRFLTLLLPLLLLAACQAPSHTQKAVPVKTYPHDPEAFTQGLFWDNGILIESTGKHGQSSLRKVPLETGKPLKRHTLETRFFAEGAVRMAERIYQLTWQSGICHVYDAETLRPLGTFRYTGEGWGLTTDGQRLIMSDGTDTLRFVSPDTFETLSTLQVHDGPTPIPNLNELEWIRGEVWANVWPSNLIVRINPQTGAVTGRIDVSPLPHGATHEEAIPNGIAFDAESDRIFLTGKYWPKLFEIRLVDVDK